MTVRVHLGAVTDLFANFLWDILDDNPGDGVTNLLGYLDAMLLGYFLLDIHWILSAHSFGKLFTLFSRDIDWEILASFIWHLLTFCSRDGFFNLLWHLFAMLLRNLKLSFVRLMNSYLMTNGIKGLPRGSHYHHPYIMYELSKSLLYLHNQIKIAELLTNFGLELGVTDDLIIA